MNETEAAAWGERERRQRIEDLKGVVTNRDIESAQKRAWQRAHNAGLTKDQATDLCIAASRRVRGLPV